MLIESTTKSDRVCACISESLSPAFKTDNLVQNNLFNLCVHVKNSQKVFQDQVHYGILHLDS